jgi:exonuclease III
MKEYKDDNENVYILDIEINGLRYGIGAIYGPNNTSREFYRFIKNTLQDLNSSGVRNIVLGGDWNTTFDRRPVVDNIDTFQMAGLPNPKNSELLEQLCRSFSLHDPYRVLFPTRKDYTYSPFGTIRLNRSRLDFFIISDSLINCISSCSIADSLSCKLFDHKQVHLVLYQQQRMQKGPLRLSNTYLNEKLLDFSVEIAARRAHVFSLLCQNNGMPNDIIRERNLD